MTSVKTAISLPPEIFAAVQALAEEEQVSRSALIVKAITEYLRNVRGETLTRRLNEAFGDELDESDHAWIDDTLHRQLSQLRDEDAGWQPGS